MIVSVVFLFRVSEAECLEIVGEDLEIAYEEVVTRFDNSAKIDAPRKCIGKKSYMVVVKD